MPDGQNYLPMRDDGAAASFPDTPDDPQPTYTPPVAMILDGLDTTELDMNTERVSVRADFLRFLIGELARTLRFDPVYYAEAHPDVEAARLAGDVASLQDHFVDRGYFERRQPHHLPFDAFYYATHYEDLSRAFDVRDAPTLRRHYDSHGWQEGRVGVAWQRADADRWVAAVRAARG